MRILSNNSHGLYDPIVATSVIGPFSQLDTPVASTQDLKYILEI